MRQATAWMMTGLFAASLAQAQTSVTKTISYALLEDYNKVQDLSQVALDFQLMNQLGIHTWRGTFGWDDYEPARGVYDFTWLHQFASLAQQNGIELRPYIAYTAPWASSQPKADDYWRYPPADIRDWYHFTYNLSSAMSVHPNITSYELYNEVDSTDFWNGSIERYNLVLRNGAQGIRTGNPRAQVAMAGLVFPDYDWMNPICSTYENGGSFDIAPFHGYPETWEVSSVESYLDVQYHDYYVPEVKFICGGQQIWMNELGFATTSGKTEQDQAYWWARAFATYLADAHIQELGIYQIRDNPPEQQVIGGEANYHLGITKVDRSPKEAFYTIGMLVKLLPPGTITIADAELSTQVTSGRTVQYYSHLFKRPDGHQIVFAYEKQSTPTVALRLSTPGRTAIHYQLDGSSAPFGNFDGTTLQGVSLAPGQIAIFEILP